MKLGLLIICMGVCAITNAQLSNSDPLSPKIRLTDSIRCTNVKDQASSPTCWVFGTNSLFESDILNISGQRLNLSEMFIARYAYIDKADMYLRTKGKSYFEGGGQFHDVLRVIDRYGMVPEAVYSGLPRNESRHDHAKLDTAMKRYVNRLLKTGVDSLESAHKRSLNDTLDKYLGKIPATFWYDLENQTPGAFAKKYLPKTSDYVELMSFSSLPYYRKCLLVDKFNWAGDSIYNIPLEDFVSLADSALTRGWSLGWEGDVTEPGFNSYSGFVELNDSTKHQFEKERVENYKTEITERDHMLHIVGVGKDERGKKWYYMKNSWGTWMSGQKGYLYMSADYLKLKTVIMMVNKAGLPDTLRKKLGIP